MLGTTEPVASPASPALTGVAAHPPAGGAHGADLAKLTLGALGVVYGDIGTSPLYALRECVTAPHGVPATPENIMGLLSLIVWSLILVISVKYLRFVMKADNEGEGGVLALMALVARRAKQTGPRRTRALIYLGLFGAALLYGDGMITPAISVLSAVEGLEVATKAFTPFVVPVTCVILVALFAVQKRGTGGIGTVFGPMTLCWFIAIAAAGMPSIIRRPEILWAVNPVHAVQFFTRHGTHGFLVLGAVVLCITGGEALYADMGHFGRRAIRVAWYTVVLPGLLINYFGQGALLLDHPETKNPFYGLVSGFWLYPMVVLATMATVVASQALISGAFSLTRQAVQLGYAPRMTIVHTSGKTEGQIFIPEVNALLMVSCVALVIGFRKSTNLADAYGIAVTGTMAITSILFFFVARDRWKWGPWRAGSLLAIFLVIDLAFFGACAAKILHGGWFPLAVAAIIFAVMTTWKRGRAILAERISSATLPLDLFITDIELCKPPRVKGTAVFLTSVRRGTPNVLLHHFKHNKVLHQQVVIVSIATDAVPEIASGQRIKLRKFDHGFWAVTAHYGFMETPDMADLMRRCMDVGLSIDLADTSYYVGRETLLLIRDKSLAFWRKRVFRFLSRNARSATDFFSI
ncbi:MAG: potassium transporter Kup, partial [Deltaproteobacteria bacterium]|nr:potassium transporter Kup [Deltaproteobacteria bacterium]